MKQYTTPEVILHAMHAQDVITLSEQEVGIGNIYSWSDGVMKEVE
jgi:hypothetical protein